MTMTTEPDADEWLSTDEISDAVRLVVARRAGVALPVHGEVIWMWAPGQGPVARVQVRHVENVVQLPVRKVAPREAG